MSFKNNFKTLFKNIKINVTKTTTLKQTLVE